MQRAPKISALRKWLIHVGDLGTGPWVHLFTRLVASNWLPELGVGDSGPFGRDFR